MGALATPKHAPPAVTIHIQHGGPVVLLVDQELVQELKLVIILLVIILNLQFKIVIMECVI